MTPAPILIVAPQRDLGAQAVARLLLAQGRAVGLWTPAQLGLLGWSHRVERGGQTRTRLWGAHSTLDASPEALGALWFRSPGPDPLRFLSAPTRDRDYAASEWQALVVSWLLSCGNRVVNAPDGQCCEGPSWDAFRWLEEARRVGLPLQPRQASTRARCLPGWSGVHWAGNQPHPASAPEPDHRVLVAGDRVLGQLADRHGEACRALATRAHCRLLAVGFHGADGRAGVCRVDLSPSLGSAEEVQAAAALLISLVEGGAL